MSPLSLVADDWTEGCQIEYFLDKNIYLLILHLSDTAVHYHNATTFNQIL